MAANPKVKFKPGNWMFIPLKRGIALFFNQEFFKDKSMQYLGQPGMFIWPVPSSKRISSYYGPRGGRNHDGIDIPARRGAHILSVADGKVIYSGNGLRGYGNLTIINHGKGIYTVYAHATKNFTKKGQKVSQGEVIATIGNTGRSSGPHLHFEVRKGDRPVDPIAYLNGTNKGLAKR